MSPLALTACGRGGKTFDVSQPRPARVALLASSGRTARPADPWGAAGLALAVRWDNDRRWILAVAEAAVAEPRTPPHSEAVVSAPGAGCGGDLPPCYVAQRESGGSYSAYNPTGCGGSGCFGKWQFSGAWAGKLGLPADIASATPAQQDEAARQLWASGSGCSNWAAC